MKPQERILTAISGGVPDRVPVAPKIWVDGAAVLLGLDLRSVIEDPATALRVLVQVGLDLGLDAVRQFHLPARRTAVVDGRLCEIDRQGRRLGVIDLQGGLATYLEDRRDLDLGDPYQVAHLNFRITPVPAVESLADLKRLVVPDKAFYRESGGAERLRQSLALAGDRLCLLGDCHSATLAFYASLRGLSTALTDLVEQPHLVHAAMEKGVAIAVEKGKFQIDLGLKILRLNDSLGSVSVISPAHWREFVYPHLKEVCDELHRYDPEVRLYCHICGNILPVLEPLIGTGLDCLGPLDPLGGVTCARARVAAGRRVSLMGGMNPLSFVSESPARIIEEARRCMLDAGRTGGFILGSGCVVPRAAPRENLAALVTAVERHGVYRNGELRCGP